VNHVTYYGPPVERTTDGFTWVCTVCRQTVLTMVQVAQGGAIFHDCPGLPTPWKRGWLARAFEVMSWLIP
jgi:hypothetical protein